MSDYFIRRFQRADFFSKLKIWGFFLCCKTFILWCTYLSEITHLFTTFSCEQNLFSIYLFGIEDPYIGPWIAHTPSPPIWDYITIPSILEHWVYTTIVFSIGNLAIADLLRFRYNKFYIEINICMAHFFKILLWHKEATILLPGSGGGGGGLTK